MRTPFTRGEDSPIAALGNIDQNRISFSRSVVVLSQPVTQPASFHPYRSVYIRIVIGSSPQNFYGHLEFLGSRVHQRSLHNIVKKHPAPPRGGENLRGKNATQFMPDLFGVDGGFGFWSHFSTPRIDHVAARR